MLFLKRACIAFVLLTGKSLRLLFLSRACVAFVLLTGKSLRLRMSTTSHYGDENAKKASRGNYPMAPPKPPP
jgi:hypothetical protein